MSSAEEYFRHRGIYSPSPVYPSTLSRGSITKLFRRIRCSTRPLFFASQALVPPCELTSFPKNRLGIKSRRTSRGGWRGWAHAIPQLQIEYTRERKGRGGRTTTEEGASWSGFSVEGRDLSPSPPLETGLLTRRMKLLKRQRHVPGDEAISNAGAGEGTSSFPARGRAGSKNGDFQLIPRERPVSGFPAKLISTFPFAASRSSHSKLLLSPLRLLFKRYLNFIAGSIIRGEGKLRLKRQIHLWKFFSREAVNTFAVY